MKSKDLNLDPSFLRKLLGQETDLPAMVLDDDGQILYFSSNNGDFENLKGNSIDGHHVEELLPKKDRQQATETFFENSGRSSTSVLTVIETGNGETKEILWNVFYADKNKEEGEIAICICEAKYNGNLSETAAEVYGGASEEARKYKTLFEYAYDAIIFSKFESGRIFEVNPEAEKLLGYSAEELLGKDFFDFFATGNVSTLRRGLQENKFFHKEHQKLIANDGSELIVTVNGSLVEYQGEETILLLFHDVTERVELEKELRDRAERLKDSKERLEELIHVISHDLKEPLRSIGTYSDMLFSKFEDELEGDGFHRLKKLKENSTKLKRMLDNVSNLTKVTLRDSTTRINVPNLVDEIVDEMSLNTRKAQIEVQQNFPEVKYDRFQLKVILRNSISNAFKHNSPPIRVIIGYEEKPNESDLTIFVEDNGQGIKKDHQKKVFRMFEQLDPGDDSEGMGAGLTFCKRIVNSRGGDIYLESENGEGTTLYFTVPKAEE